MEIELKKIKTNINDIYKTDDCNKRIEKYNNILEDLVKLQNSLNDYKKQINNIGIDIDFIEDINDYDLNQQMDELDKLFNLTKEKNLPIEEYINNYLKSKKIILSCREFINTKKSSLKQLHVTKDNKYIEAKIK